MNEHQLLYWFQVGLSEPHRLGQASSVTIRLFGRAPMQSDGEPWIQDPAEIKVKFHKTVSILKVVRWLMVTGEWASLVYQPTHPSWILPEFGYVLYALYLYRPTRPPPPPNHNQWSRHKSFSALGPQGLWRIKNYGCNEFLYTYLG